MIYVAMTLKWMRGKAPIAALWLVLFTSMATHPANAFETRASMEACFDQEISFDELTARLSESGWLQLSADSDILVEMAFQAAAATVWTDIPQDTPTTEVSATLRIHHARLLRELRRSPASSGSRLYIPATGTRSVLLLRHRAIPGGLVTWQCDFAFSDSVELSDTAEFAWLRSTSYWYGRYYEQPGEVIRLSEVFREETGGLLTRQIEIGMLNPENLNALLGEDRVEVESIYSIFTRKWDVDFFPTQ